IHLTLKFLGNVARVALPDLQSAVVRACSRVGPFELRVQGMGAFPSGRSPRVVWAGIFCPTQALGRLQSNLDLATTAWTEVNPQKFHAELTLGRVVQPRVARALTEFVDIQPAVLRGAWVVEEVELMQSHLSPQGAMHTVLHHERLEAIP